MKIIDMHSDVLLKLYNSNGHYKFRDSLELDTSYEKLKRGGVKVQAFALFVNPDVNSDEKFQVALDQIHYFYSDVIANNSSIKLIKDWSDILHLKESEIGAILALEGVDAIGNDLRKLSILHELGVRSVGLTWNNANLAADGAGEKRGAGLTEFGREIIAFNNRHKLFTDVSHLCERAFWDVIDEASYLIASHSNARTICDHVRNLTDEQAKAMFLRQGLIHVVYCPQFIRAGDTVTISDMVKHIDHFCSLGGEKQIGLGSDFDGISKKVCNLEDASMHPALVNELLKRYSEDMVKGFAYQNFLDHLPR